MKAPKRVAVSSPYQAVKLTLGADCAAAGVVDAYWYARHATAGPVTPASFEDGAKSDLADVYDFDPLGRWMWQGSGAFDRNGRPVAQKTAYTDVKVASWSRVKAVRAGAKVTLSVSAARYAHTLDRFVPWVSAAGQLQHKPPGGRKWIPLKSVRTDAAGRYTYSYTTTAVRDYRVYFPATSVIWEVASPTVRK